MYKSSEALDTTANIVFTGTPNFQGGAQSYRPINDQSGQTTYTLVLSDFGKMILFGSGAASSLTIPTNASVAFPIGTEIDVVQMNAGQVQFVNPGGVTILSQNSLTHLALRYAGGTIKKLATDTWLLIGNLI